MNKPYIICHMMTSVDGRIDCAMTEHLPGVQEYYDTLDELDTPSRISGRVTRACEILSEKFGVKRAAVVGGGHINAAFLTAGLLNEVSILIGSGIDGRGGMASVIDGLPMDCPVTPLKLSDVRQYQSGAVWLRYFVK